MSETTKRLDYLDLAGGILIMWVMIFHALNVNKVFGEVDTRVFLPYLTFSMPWFFYKSGYLYKASDGFFKRNLSKLFYPYLKWSLIGYLVFLLMQIVDGNLSCSECFLKPFHTLYIYGYLPINVPLWFVLSFFIVKVVSDWLIRVVKIPVYIYIILGIAIGFGLHLLDNPDVPYYLANIPMGISFFMIGHYFGRYENNIYVFVVSTIVFVLFLIFGPSIVGHHRNILLEGYYLLWPVFACSGIVTFNNLCKIADKKNPCRLLNFIGRNTITLLLMHGLVYGVILHYSSLSSWQTAILTIICYVVLFTPILLIKNK